MAFPQTHCSVVLAVRSVNPEERARALDALFAAYWPPVHRHIATRWRRELRAAALEKPREITAGEDEFRSEARALLGVEVR